MEVNTITMTQTEEKVLKLPLLAKSNLKSASIVPTFIKKGGSRLDHQIIAGKHIFHNYGLGSDEALLGYAGATLIEKVMNLKVTVHEANECAVIGAGAMGLFTALELIRNGQKVTVYADNLHELNHKTKGKTATVPRHFMPNHYDWSADSLKHELQAKIAYDYLKESAKYSRYQGVRSIRAYDLVTPKEDLKEVVSQYVFDTFEDSNLRFEGRQTQKAVNYNTVIVDTSLLLEELRVEVLLRGGKMVQRKFNTQEELIDGVKENFIFNCTTSGSLYLFNDKELEQHNRLVLEFDTKSSQQEYVLTAGNGRENFEIYCLRKKTYVVAETVSQRTEEATAEVLKAVANFINTRTLMPTL